MLDWASPDLLEELRVIVQCTYISDLSAPPYGAEAICFLSEIEMEKYPLSEWTSAIAYLTKSNPTFHSYEAVSAYLAHAQAPGRMRRP